MISTEIVLIQHMTNVLNIMVDELYQKYYGKKVVIYNKLYTVYDIVLENNEVLIKCYDENYLYECFDSTVDMRIVND